MGTVKDMLKEKASDQLMRVAITVEGVDDIKTIEEDIVWLKDGVYPVFAKNATEESDARISRKFYIPEKIIKEAAGESKKESYYKRKAKEWMSTGKTVLITARKSWGTNKFNVSWKWSMPCYEVSTTWSDIWMCAPMLQHYSTGNMESFELGKIEIRIPNLLYEWEFELESMPMSENVYMDAPMFMKMKHGKVSPLQDEELNEIGWEKSNWRTGKEEGYTPYTVMARAGSKGLAKVITENAPIMGAILAYRETFKEAIGETEGGYTKSCEGRDGEKITARYERPSGRLLEMMEGYDAPEECKWPAKMMVSIRGMEPRRRRDLRDAVPRGWDNWSVWGDYVVWYMLWGEKKDALMHAKSMIDAGTMGKTTSWKLADMDKKPKSKEDEEEKSETEELKGMVEKLETEENFREYLLYKIKVLEKAVKRMEGAMK